MTSLVRRCLIVASVSLLFLTSYLFLFLHVLPEYIYPLNLPFYGWLSIFLFLASPIILITIYGLMRGLVPPQLHEAEGIPKNWKGWAFAYVFLLAYIIYFALWAFIFDNLTPFIPFFYRQIIAPQIIFFSTLIIFSRFKGIRKTIRRLLSAD